MAVIRNPDVLQPWSLDVEGAPRLERYAWRLLAVGDSWFSIGALNPFKNANLVNQLEFSRSVAVVNCAQPSDTLSHIAQLGVEPWFQDLLCGNRARPWSGIVVSGGGNDLIAATQVAASGNAGSNASLRLLLKPHEWGPASLGVARFLSASGWQRFNDYLVANFEHLVALRDDAGSQSRGAPIFAHTYAFPTARNAPAGPLGPWLYPAMRLYQLPVSEWIAIGHELLSRLSQSLQSIAADSQRFPNVHVFDSANQVAIEQAHLGDTGSSGDWGNEIHLTRKGCAKVGAAWGPAIERVLKARRA
jgi:hypothetical protein